MEEPLQLSLEKFREQLKPKQVRVFQIIALVMGTGASLFFLIVLILYFYHPITNEELLMKEPNLALVQILTLVHVVEAVSLYIVGFFAFRFVVSKRQLRRQLRMTFEMDEGRKVFLESRCVGILFSGMIIRLALYEGVALFGLIICLLGTKEGILEAYPEFWLNLFSFVFLIFYVIITFPTRQRLEDIFQRRFGNPDVLPSL